MKRINKVLLVVAGMTMVYLMQAGCQFQLPFGSPVHEFLNTAVHSVPIIGSLL